MLSYLWLLGSSQWVNHWFALGSAQGSQPWSTVYSWVEPLCPSSVMIAQPFRSEETEWELLGSLSLCRTTCSTYLCLKCLLFYGFINCNEIIIGPCTCQTSILPMSHTPRSGCAQHFKQWGETWAVSWNSSLWFMQILVPLVNVFTESE